MQDSVLNRYEVERYIHATAARADLEVVWTSKDSPPCTNGKKIYLPEIHPSSSTEDINNTISYAIHEVEHNKHTDFNVLKNYESADPTKSLIGALTNMLEDDNIDYKNAQEFIGDRQIRSLTTANNIRGIIDKIKELEGKELGQEAKDMVTAMSWGCSHLPDYYRDTVGLAEEMQSYLAPDQAAKLSKLKASDYSDVLKNLREMQDDSERTLGVFRLAQRIAKEVFEMDPEEEEKKAQAKAKAEGKNGKGEGSGEEGESSSGGESKEGEGDDPSKSSSVVDYKTFLVDQSNHKGTPNADQHIRYEDREYDGTYSPSPLQHTEVVDYVKKTVSAGSGVKTASLTDVRSIRRDLINHDTSGFNNAVRRLLQIRSKGRWEYGQKRGALHNAALYRLTLKDAHGYNSRIFRKKITSDVLDTCVGILVDISGSMSGTKVSHAANAASHISDTIGNTLHIPCEIIGFTENNCKNSMFIYRSFDCKHVKSEDLVTRIGASCKYMEQNADGDSILWEYSRIIHRKEKRKLLIVLSDGSPASSKAGDCMSYTKRVVKEIEASKAVDIVAVGIQDDNVKRIYSENYVIRDASEIENALLTIIKRKVV